MKDLALRHLREELAELDQRGLLRQQGEPVDAASATAMLSLCSNDYLGYRSSRRLDRFARDAVARHPVGAGASRLVAGDHRAHRALELALAGWLECDETLVFTSGYAANVGVLAALADEGDLIVSDALNHASIIDGCRLSRARTVVVPHNATDRVREVLMQSTARRRWVVTESYFSMDGDGPDLVALRGICDEWDAALIVDEAHALGVMGPSGRGRAASMGVKPDVLVGTMGKALAGQGAFVAGSADLCRWLWNRARSFVFSTGLSPFVAAVGVGAIAEAKSDDVGRERLVGWSNRLRDGLRARGIDVANREGPILPIVVGGERSALDWSRALAQEGVLVQAIRPPTVPSGASRLRLTVRADLTEPEVERALQAFGAAAQGRGT